MHSGVRGCAASPQRFLTKKEEEDGHRLVPGPAGAQPLLATSPLKAKLLPSQSCSGPIRPWHRPLRTGAGRTRTPASSGARHSGSRGAGPPDGGLLSAADSRTEMRSAAPSEKGHVPPQWRCSPGGAGRQDAHVPCCSSVASSTRSGNSSSALPSCGAARRSRGRGAGIRALASSRCPGPTHVDAGSRASPRSLKRPRAAQRSLRPGSGRSRGTRPPLPGFTPVPPAGTADTSPAQRSAVQRTPAGGRRRDRNGEARRGTGPSWGRVRGPALASHRPRRSSLCAPRVAPPPPAPPRGRGSLSHAPLPTPVLSSPPSEPWRLQVLAARRALSRLASS